MTTLEQSEKKYRRQDEVRARCDSANRLAAMLGDSFMQGSAATLATLVSKVPITLVIDELYGWMKASGLTPSYARKLCRECMPLGVTGQAAVEVTDNECSDILCRSRRARAARCVLCRCAAVATAHGFPVCTYHQTRGEDGPPCPDCVRRSVDT